tara:strand:+ start:1794 stop:2669 length:876 start_codon:yes stop_codon:yes gene_type:complete
MQQNLKLILTIYFGINAMILCVQTTFADTSFVRFVPGNGEWEGELQTAIVSYQNNEGIIVDLVSAIHLGEESYYDYLNQYFSERDVVLYELVANENDRPSPGSAVQNLSVISFLQRILGNLFGVSYQLEQIDYSVTNFLHADLTPDELSQIMIEKEESMFSIFVALASAQFANEQLAIQQGERLNSFNLIGIANVLLAEDQNTALKYVFAKELGHPDGLIVGPELESQITILGDRNEAALEVLEETLSDPTVRKISIFYGAAHMPGIERGLLNTFNFQKKGQRWVNAWVMP